MLKMSALLRAYCQFLFTYRYTGGRYDVKELLASRAKPYSKLLLMQIYNGGRLESYGQGWTGGVDFRGFQTILGQDVNQFWLGLVGFRIPCRRLRNVWTMLVRLGGFQTIWGRHVKGGDTTLRNFCDDLGARCQGGEIRR